MGAGVDSDIEQGVDTGLLAKEFVFERVFGSGQYDFPRLMPGDAAALGSRDSPDLVHLFYFSQLLLLRPTPINLCHCVWSCTFLRLSFAPDFSGFMPAFGAKRNSPEKKDRRARLLLLMCTNSNLSSNFITSVDALTNPYLIKIIRNSHKKRSSLMVLLAT